jgi:hypothetical protein
VWLLAEVTTKHTKNTKNCIFRGTARAMTSSNREVSLTLKKAQRSYLMREEMPFVLFVCFVVTSTRDNHLPDSGFDITFQYEIP